MARTKDSSFLKDRTARAPLEIRKEPYWFTLEKSRFIGYRKAPSGGTWIARYYNPSAKPPMLYKPLGAADDHSDPDGKMVLDWSQAQAGAREWFKAAFHEATGDVIRDGAYTVADAIADYLADKERQGSTNAERTRKDMAAHVIPHLGTIPADRLTRKRIEAWMLLISKSGRRRRGKEREAPSGPDEIRARRSTANRLWTDLRAALNHAMDEHLVENNLGWAGVRAFRKVDVARVHFLSADEQVRLVNCCVDIDFRHLVQAGLFTGGREGELAAVQARHFDAENGAVYVDGKTGPRWITLTEEAQEYFRERCAGLEASAIVFPRTVYARKDRRNTGGWDRAEIGRKLKAALRAAKLEPMVFHELRHTYASGLVNRGVPLVFVAQNLGHRDTRQVEKHYGHLCKTAKVEAIRKLAPTLGIYQPEGVASLKIKT